MLDFIDEPLDQIAFLVDVLVIRDGLRSTTSGWDYGLRTVFCDRGAKAIGVKTHISEEVLERKPTDQVFGLDDVVHLASSQDEPDGIAESLDANVYLRTQLA